MRGQLITLTHRAGPGIITAPAHQGQIASRPITQHDFDANGPSIVTLVQCSWKMSFHHLQFQYLIKFIKALIKHFINRSYDRWYSLKQ